MDHRLVQRTLFRMQLDPVFAVRVRAGGVDGDDLSMLRAADPRAVAADRDGKRRAQFLTNVSSEFPLSCAANLCVDGFTASEEFHDAVCADRSLPLAFARYASRCSREEPLALRALIALESALVGARRELRPCLEPRSGEVALAPWAWLGEYPAGTLALAARLREALDRGTKPASIALPPGPHEVLLLLADPEPEALRLRDVEVEALSPALGELLFTLRSPRPRMALDRDADDVVAGLLTDRVLVAACSSPRGE